MRPGQKSPTTMHDQSSSDKEQEEGINYTTVDWREFLCNTWHLEPTLRSALNLNHKEARAFHSLSLKLLNECHEKWIRQ